MQQRIARMPSLDMFRMLACAMVVGYHYLFIGPLESHWPPAMRVNALYFGYFGVDLFFIISGFVIAWSSQGKTALAYASARVNRIVPTFIVCGLILYGFAVSLPGISAQERAYSLLVSMTFFPTLFGVDYFSSVYWTLRYEVTFYLWVYLLIRAGVWERHRNGVCLVWCMLSLLNHYVLQSPWITFVILSDYSGCFIIGIVLYQLKTQTVKPVHVLLLAACVVLIQAKMQAHNQWIDGYNVGVSQAVLWITACILPCLAWCVSRLGTWQFGARQAAFAGALSYPFYLLHADIGFWAHAIFERKWFALYPWTQSVLSYPLMMLLALVVSLGLSVVVVKIIDPVCQRLLKPCWARFQV